MIISINWMKKFTTIDQPIDQLATRIGARLVEIEEVIDLGQKYKDVIIARVAHCEKLEGSDHLRVTKLDDGGVVADVERDEQGLVQVVCGAPNIREGLLVAWLPPRATVPESFHDAEPFVLGARKLRGVMSNGMVASAKELDLGDSHEGIAELIHQDAVAGARFADVYELNDYLLDIENKSLTHRPDAFGVLGFTREVAAISGQVFRAPSWADATLIVEQATGDQVIAPQVVIDDASLSDRYQGLVLSRTAVHDGNELSLQDTYLARSGVRPISPIVDVTNYLMLLAGQPLHAFDYDKLCALSGQEQPTIHVRAGRVGETLELLDERTVELSPDDIVIAAGETAIALGGAMGGRATEIDESTTRVFLESATFNLYSLRATQMRHGIFSEAITRFTKGQPAELTAPVLAEATRLLQDRAGLTPISQVAEAYPGRHQPVTLSLATEQVNELLGTTIATEDIARVLESVSFAVEVSGNQLQVTVPYWRADIHITEDLIEEIGRIRGFDEITPTVPRRDFIAVRPQTFDQLRSRMRKLLVRAGANEVLTYSFVHGDVMSKVGQNPAESYRITNSISPELQYYRQSITPSLLGLIHPNSKQGYDSFAIFELNKVHSKLARLVENESVPAEMHRLGLVVTSRTPGAGAAYYQARELLEYLGTSLGLQLLYKPFDEPTNLTFARPFDHRRSARVVDAHSGQSIGIVGEYRRPVSKNFKLPAYTAGFELLPEAIELALQHPVSTYRPVSRYPSTDRDICFQVATEVAYQTISQLIEEALQDSDIETSVLPVDLYQAEGAAVKNVTVRIKLTPHDRTLTGDEVQAVVDQVIQVVVPAVNATVI